MNTSDPSLARQDFDSSKSRKASASQNPAQLRSKDLKRQSSRKNSMNNRSQTPALSVKKNKRPRQKRSYNKISFEQLRMLKGFFSKNVYPCRAEIEKLSAELGLCYIKIDNWFKHNRRLNVQKGVLKYSKKRNFSNEEVTILKEYLEGKDTLSQAVYRKIAKQFGCNESNIKNWFSYHRRKLKEGTISQDQEPLSNEAANFSHESATAEATNTETGDQTMDKLEKLSESMQDSNPKTKALNQEWEEKMTENKPPSQDSGFFYAQGEETCSKKPSDSSSSHFTSLAAQTNSLLQKNNEEITSLRSIIAKVSQNLLLVQNENAMLRNYQEVLKSYLIRQQLSQQGQLIQLPLLLNSQNLPLNSVNIPQNQLFCNLLSNPQQNGFFRQQY